MIYTRRNKLDYDLWEAEGNPGWSYKDVLPYFLKSEDINVKINDIGYHNKGGPLGVEMSLPVFKRILLLRTDFFISRQGGRSSYIKNRPVRPHLCPQAM
nr:unnamed protein product [Callosobruchus chinensis]